MKQRLSLLLSVIVSLSSTAIAQGTTEDQSANFTLRTLTLPDHGKGSVTTDYIAYDPATGFPWVPAINIGVVYVVDTSNDRIREIPDFAKIRRFRAARSGAALTTFDL
jgi:DNA-binding beta-propeller fold protein YncE